MIDVSKEYCVYCMWSNDRNLTVINMKMTLSSKYEHIFSGLLSYVKFLNHCRPYAAYRYYTVSIPKVHYILHMILDQPARL